MSAKFEGKSDVLPIEINSAGPINEPLPYTMKTTQHVDVNELAEGLENNLLPDDDEPQDGIDDHDEIIEQNGDKIINTTPGCCRRYSCCYPLVIILLVWLMMVSAQSFEHCQDCISTDNTYRCRTESADYYCKPDGIQICCYYGDECHTVDYPSAMPVYSMGEYFNLSMYIILIFCLMPLLFPCGLPLLMYYDCRKKKISSIRQCFFDILGVFCFVCASVGSSWTIFEYYDKPKHRCSTNTELFGISTDHKSDYPYGEQNVWIMSQTTYCSFFAFIFLCCMIFCGSITFCLQAIAKRKKKNNDIDAEYE